MKDMISKNNLNYFLKCLSISISIGLFFVALMILSCNNQVERQEYQEKQEDDRWHGFSVIVIDSCEYLIKKEKDIGVGSYYGFGYFGHKGNCRFCKERNEDKD